MISHAPGLNPVGVSCKKVAVVIILFLL